MVDGVENEVEVPDDVPLPEGVFVALTVAVTLDDLEILEVIDAKAPFVTDPVGVRDFELERL